MTISPVAPATTRPGTGTPGSAGAGQGSGQGSGQGTGDAFATLLALTPSTPVETPLVPVETPAVPGETPAVPGIPGEVFTALGAAVDPQVADEPADKDPVSPTAALLEESTPSTVEQLGAALAVVAMQVLPVPPSLAAALERAVAGNAAAVPAAGPVDQPAGRPVPEVGATSGPAMTQDSVEQGPAAVLTPEIEVPTGPGHTTSPSSPEAPAPAPAGGTTAEPAPVPLDAPSGATGVPSSATGTGAGTSTSSTPAPTGAAAVTGQVFPELGRLVSRGDGTHRLTLKLAPEALGEVRVVVTVRHGEVQVHLAGGDLAQRAMAHGLPELHRLLELAGASASQVSIGDQPSPGQSTGQSTGQDTGHGTGHSTGSDTTDHRSAGTRDGDTSARDGDHRGARPRPSADPAAGVAGSTRTLAGVDVRM